MYVSTHRHVQDANEDASSQSKKSKSKNKKEKSKGKKKNKKGGKTKKKKNSRKKKETEKQKEKRLQKEKEAEDKKAKKKAEREAEKERMKEYRDKVSDAKKATYFSCDVYIHAVQSAQKQRIHALLCTRTLVYVQVASSLTNKISDIRSREQRAENLFASYCSELEPKCNVQLLSNLASSLFIFGACHTFQECHFELTFDRQS